MAMAAYAAAIAFLAVEFYEKNVANKFEKTPRICGQKSWDSTAEHAIGIRQVFHHRESDGLAIVERDPYGSKSRVVDQTIQLNDKRESRHDASFVVLKQLACASWMARRQRLTIGV